MRESSTTTTSTTSMTYGALLARLHDVRQGGVVLGLERVRAALKALGDPQRNGRYVQIAGTNGKGSTAAMTAALLQAGGLRTGLYTSPHLSRFTERIRVDGREFDGDTLARLDLRIQATGVPLTYFEVATVLAFLAFAEAGIDAGVLETGLGGRWDATTVCPAVATAITGIALDHTDILGDTVVAIAHEKAGIARPGVPLYLGPMSADADAEIARCAAEVGAIVLRFGQEFKVVDGLIRLALPGAHQRVNASLAVGLAREVLAFGGGVSRTSSSSSSSHLSDDAIAQALRGVFWPGRLERIAPDLLLDCAHNPDGAMSLARYLDECAAAESASGRLQSRALVLSVVEGKDAQAILATLAPRFEWIYATQSSSPRAIPAESLRASAPASLRDRMQVVADPMDAIAAARRQRTAPHATSASLQIVVAGSIFLVGDVRANLLGEPRDPIATADPLAGWATQTPPASEPQQEPAASDRGGPKQK